MILAEITLPLIYIHNKSLEHVHGVSLFRSSSTPDRRGVQEPGLTGEVIAFLFQFRRLCIGPAGHGEAFASMTDGLVTRFTVVAYKGKVFDANSAKTKLFDCATVGAFAVCWQTGQFSDFVLCCS